MDISRASELINKLIADPNFKSVALYNETHQIFDVLQLNENYLTKVFAWLLNPMEGHGLGDYFVKAMLFEALSKTTKSVDLSCLQLASMSLDRLQVYTEHEIDDKRRIDLLLTSLDQKLIVVVEHKYGSKEHNGQLAAYSSWANKQFSCDEQPCGNPSGYKVLRILMDGMGNISEEQLDDSQRDKWACIDHQWLLSALKNIVDTDSIPAEINLLLKDLYIYLAGDYKKDRRYENAESLLATVAHDHFELVANVGNICIDGVDDGWLLYCDDIEMIQYQKQHSCVDWSGIMDVYYFLQRYSTLLNSLEVFTKLEWVGEKLGQGFSTETNTGRAKNASINVFNNAWKVTLADNQGYWPVYINVSENNPAVDQGADKESPNQGSLSYDISLYLQRRGFCNEKSQAMPAHLAEAYGYKLSANWLTRRLHQKTVKGSLGQEFLIKEIQSMLDDVDQKISQLLVQCPKLSEVY